MRASRSLLAPPILAALASIALAGCGDSGSTPAPGAPGAPGALGGGGGAVLGKKMPEFTPSGIKDDFKKLKELKDAVKHARVKEEKEAAGKALEDFKAEVSAKWTGREVPAPEAHYLANILKELEKHAEAVTQARRWLEVAPDDNVNYTGTTTLLIGCLAESGDYEGAMRELKATADTVYKNKDQQRAELVGTIALTMLKHGKLEMALETFENRMTANMGDIESAILAVETAQRLGKPQEAVRLAQKAADFFTEGRHALRAQQLLESAKLIGQPAPGFAGAKWWEGSRAPFTPEMFKGKVTVIFAWNMQSAWNTYYFERLHAMLKDTAEKGVQLVGISRLARFDPLKMGTKKELTDEEELKFYEMWTNQYGVTYPLAVDGYESEALMKAWGAHTVPYFCIVGKDGNVAAIGFGKDEERFVALRHLVDLALAK
jgi:tetratricopeptide (TPR) repeat protein